MFWDFIDKYRQARAPERQERDRQYDEERRQISNISPGIGSIYVKAAGIAGTNVKQGLDNVGRGLSDFFSAYRDSMRGGHGKIKEKDNDFYKQDSKNYADVKNVDDVDYSRSFALYRMADDGKSSDMADSIKVGFKDGKIATVLAYRTNPETGKKEEWEIHGRDNLADYFKKFYDYDRQYATKPLDDDIPANIWASQPSDKYYLSDGFTASELFRPRDKK